MSDKTGYVTPVWENRTAPCGGLVGCPAYTNIAAALHALATNDVGQAWRIMMESHPLRAVLGRVCYGFCETPCNRGSFDKPISIQKLEAVIGDYGFDPDWRPEIAEPNGKTVYIVGSGPCGLTAGWFLNIAGFNVEIFEAEEKPGGMLRYGIPTYRLERETLDREIGLIEASGVKINKGRKLTHDDIVSFLESGECDSVIISTGAGKGRTAGIDGEKNALNGLEFLKGVNSGAYKKSEFKGKEVVVIGGGNVAMDACRSAVRLGAKSVSIMYRRTEEMMPAHDYEVEDAKAEGVEFKFLLSPESYDGTTLKIRKMELGEPDYSGRQTPVSTDEIVDFKADALIMAIGQEPHAWEIAARDKVYMAGDVDPESVGTVIHAVASGKMVADEVSNALVGKQLFSSLREEVTYEKMNIDRYFTPGMRLIPYREKPAKRRKNFNLVERVASLEEAVVEADRCFRCGLCIGGLDSNCDWCFKACSSKDGINKLMVDWNPEGPLFERKDDCDTCGRCWEDCPRYVVRPMVVEDNQ